VIPSPITLFSFGRGGRGEGVDILDGLFICKTLIPDPSPLAKNTPGEGSRVLLIYRVLTLVNSQKV